MAVTPTSLATSGLLYSCHLRQRGLRPRQPERHLHGAVERDGTAQFGAGVVAPAHLDVQLSKTEMTVGLERAHAKFVSEGKGLAIMGFGLFDRWGIPIYSDLAQEPQGPRLISSALVLSGELERSLGDLDG